MQLARSLVFQFWFFFTVTVAAALVFLSWPLSHDFRFGIARLWARGMLWAGRFFCGLDYVVEGEDHIPAEPAVILIKHSTVFETYAQIATFPRQSWVVKRELKWIPVFGWGLAAMKPIAIDRGAGRTAVGQVIAQGLSHLKEGTWVTVFPEGTRMPAGTTRKYGISGAALAKEAGVRIVPVAHNAGDFWPRRGLTKRPGLIRFCIGPSIDPQGRTPKETNLVVQDWIESRMAEISAGGASVGAASRRE